jgi:hypothetical protein
MPSNLKLKCRTCDRQREIFAPVQADGKTLNPGDKANWDQYVNEIFEDVGCWLEKLLKLIDWHLDRQSKRHEEARKDNLPDETVLLVRPAHLAEMFSQDLSGYWMRSHWKSVPNIRASNGTVPESLNGWKVARKENGALMVEMDRRTMGKLEDICMAEYEGIARWYKELDHVTHYGNAGYEEGKKGRLMPLNKARERLGFWFEILDALIEEDWYDTVHSQTRDSTGSGAELECGIPKSTDLPNSTHGQLTGSALSLAGGTITSGSNRMPSTTDGVDTE